MGKITGFMDFERLEEGYKPVPERLKNYKEFVIGLDDQQAGQQAHARRTLMTDDVIGIIAVQRRAIGMHQTGQAQTLPQVARLR